MQVSTDSRIFPAHEGRNLVVPDGGLVVPREGIRFRDVAPGLVRIWVDVVNRGPRRSKPTRMRIESAPLGAFVAWRPLREDLVVAPIAPGGTGRVVLTVPRPEPRALGGAGKGAVRSLKVASGFGPEGESRPWSRTPGARRPDTPRIDPKRRERLQVSWFVESVLQKHFPQIYNDAFRSELGSLLPPSILDVDGPQPHWAGNLNVWIGETPVERHLAPRLRIYPERANVARFFVGSRQDDYLFRVEGLSPGWGCRLLSSGEDVTWESDVTGEPRWLSLPPRSSLFLVLTPPPYCAAGQVVVHVTQRSTGREVAVEFDFDPSAPGPGCITL